MLRVTIWNEHLQDKTQANVIATYPDGINAGVGKAFESEKDITIQYATMDMPDHGLTQDVIDNTDVLIWWAHCGHDKVEDAIAARVIEAVHKSMGFIALHSAHLSKPFTRLLGSTGTLRWRDNDRERIWVTSPAHPIAQGLPEYFELPVEEMYGEHFDVPNPDDVVFIGWFAGGEVFRSGMTWRRGYGKVFYFQPGHEEYPTYFDKNIQQVLRNAARWAAPTMRRAEIACPNPKPLETV